MNMSKQCKVIVHLTGGLGNQLFQYAAALSLKPQKIILECSVGKPRRDGEGEPEISAYLLHENTEFQKTKNPLNFAASKAAGFLLRSGTTPKNWENNKAVKLLLNIAGGIVISIWRKQILVLTQGRGVGFAPLEQTKFDRYLVGYFQSYKYSDSVNPEIKKIKLANPGMELLQVMQDAETELPLVVHFRFGDYLQEDKFGQPSSQYYCDAIGEMWSTGRYKKIWVFSDEIEKAKFKFPLEFLSHVRWMENIDDSSASTLEAMRFGRGYVIANSTFSWWGAYISHTDQAEVIAPDPWFQGMDSPDNLLPGNWQKRNSLS